MTTGGPRLRTGPAVVSGSCDFGATARGSVPAATRDVIDTVFVRARRPRLWNRSCVTILPPAADEPRRPEGPRDPGDAWVVAPDGAKYWGRFGAAGLLAVDEVRGVLLQKRVEWSHHGGTWGIPGGALHEGEAPIDGALRESHEEAAVPSGSVRPLATLTYELGFWRYTTLLATVETPFEPQITDAESLELRWVPVDEVEDLPLHPGFAAAWPRLRRLLNVRPVIIVDVANVIGSTPNGWWKDRVGSTQEFLGRLSRFADDGVDVTPYGYPDVRMFPWIVAVIEGQARGAEDVAGVTVVRADGSGDDAIVAAVALAGHEEELQPIVTVVTSDRALRERVLKAGGDAQGVAWLKGLMGE